MSIVDGGSGYFDDTKFLSYSIGRRHLWSAICKGGIVDLYLEKFSTSLFHMIKS
jgi:hypothetical protein